MSEIVLNGFYEKHEDPKEEWGLDGWSWKDRFQMVLTFNGESTIASLNPEQCSRLAAALIEHVKEVHDASKENLT